MCGWQSVVGERVFSKSESKAFIDKRLQVAHQFHLISTRAIPSLWEIRDYAEYSGGSRESP